MHIRARYGSSFILALSDKYYDEWLKAMLVHIYKSQTHTEDQNVFSQVLMSNNNISIV